MHQVERQRKGVILMHDIHQQTARAVPMILDEMNRRGFLDWARSAPAMLSDYVSSSPSSNQLQAPN
jgi:hypothetical protein